MSNLGVTVRPDYCGEFTIEITDGAVAVAISAEPDNRLEMKADGLYVKDRLDPDPVAYYLLARG